MHFGSLSCFLKYSIYGLKLCHYYYNPVLYIFILKSDYIIIFCNWNNKLISDSIPQKCLSKLMKNCNQFKTDSLWWCNGPYMWLLCIKYSLCTLNPIVFPGHGDGNSRNVPTLVKDMSGIGQVSCGSSHTVAVSQDGWSVWSFGGGDNGILRYPITLPVIYFLLI